MKVDKVSIAFCCFLIASILISGYGIAFGQTWHTADSKAFEWDPVPPIDATDIIKYQVWTKFKIPNATPQKSGVEITTTQATVTFSEEGRYYLCAQAIRYPLGETEGEVSEISCSDQAEYCLNGQTFGVKYFIKPDRPHNLR